MSLRNEVFTIAVSGTASNGIECGADDLIGVRWPAKGAQTYTKATVQASFDPPGTETKTWVPVGHDVSGAAVELTAPTAATAVTLPVETLHGLTAIRLVLDAAASGSSVVIRPIARCYF